MNNITRFVPPAPPVGTQSGQWMWNGTSWVCDADNVFPPVTGGNPNCPPPSFPPGGCPPWFPPPQGQPPWYPGANAGVSFSQTAPVNPVRGHFWWNGTQLQMFDGAAWVVVGGTAASGTTPPLINPPANPVAGQQWFDGTTLFVWDGNAWIPVSQTQTFIQGTAPPSPKPGDTWWDGTQFRIWSGSAWQLVGPGATVGPVGTTTIEFAMTSTTARPLTAAAWTIVPFNDSPLTDTLNGWDSVQHKYTPTKAGVYNFMARGAPAGGGGIAILKNDPGTFTNALTSDLIIGISSQSSGWTNANGFAPMNGTTDYVRVWANSVSGSWPATGGNAVFTGTLMP